MRVMSRSAECRSRRADAQRLRDYSMLRFKLGWLDVIRSAVLGAAFGRLFHVG